MTDASALIDPFTRMLQELFPADAVAAVEEGDGSFDGDAAWAELDASGFLDALLPESAGGAGLTLSDVAPLLIALGAQGVPLPIGDTMLARAIGAAAGIDVPGGVVVLSSLRAGHGLLPFGRVAQWMMVDGRDAPRLLGVDRLSQSATGVPFDLGAFVAVPDEANGIDAGEPGPVALAAALVRAATIAGAGARALDMTAAHAAQRVQFGKPIAAQQAIQQQLAVMAEQVVAARLAVESASAPGLPLCSLSVAAAKAVTSRDAAAMAATAHAVHGAIGISADYDLHRFTRALHAARLADGSESAWEEALGRALLADDAPRSLDMLRRLFRSSQ